VKGNFVIFAESDNVRGGGAATGGIYDRNRDESDLVEIGINWVPGPIPAQNT